MDWLVGLTMFPIILLGLAAIVRAARGTADEQELRDI